MARVLINAAEHTAALRQKSRTALALFRQTYSADAVIPRILEVYERMLRTSSASG